jgi:hypothetical protein
VCNLPWSSGFSPGRDALQPPTKPPDAQWQRRGRVAVNSEAASLDDITLGRVTVARAVLPPVALPAVRLDVPLGWRSSPATEVARRRKKTTTKKVTKRVTKRKNVSVAVVEEVEVDEAMDTEEDEPEEEQEQEPAPETLRRTRTGRITKPSAKLAAKRREDAYS